MRQERIHAENWRVDDLIPDPKNPRRNEAAVPGVRESIRAFGFRVPIVIDAGGNVVAGHTRLAAAKELGMEEVPCVKADQLSPKELKAYQLADNKTAEFSSWDKGLLVSELDDLLGAFDMSLFGFNLQATKGDTKPTKDPQFVTCPRCGKRIPRHQTVEYSVEDFESEDWEGEEGDPE